MAKVKQSVHFLLYLVIVGCRIFWWTVPRG